MCCSTNPSNLSFCQNVNICSKSIFSKRREINRNIFFLIKSSKNSLLNRKNVYETYPHKQNRLHSIYYICIMVFRDRQLQYIMYRLCLLYFEKSHVALETMAVMSRAFLNDFLLLDNSSVKDYLKKERQVISHSK